MGLLHQNLRGIHMNGSGQVPGSSANRANPRAACANLRISIMPYIKRLYS
jgi:hypothetical protein